jgi:hypothetical protein
LGLLRGEKRREEERRGEEKGEEYRVHRGVDSREYGEEDR